ncbi:MAG: hypothetical protein QOH01_2905 [Verrucomicrobiota bacterium]|jgi:hypothetical protein
MVHVSIAGEDRDLRDASSAWLRAAVEKRRHSDSPICIKVSILSGVIDMLLATKDCPAIKSDDFRPFRGEEIRIFHDWQTNRLDTDNFSISDLEAFLISLRKFQA